MPPQTTQPDPTDVPGRKNFNLSLPTLMCDELDEEAASIGLSRAALIRVILRRHLTE